ncbi:hypothetical protein [Shewanella indica]|uniref:hypothetical protein n=1 Tax=Shewanella indica TaxID=768528 RepID=UPI0020447A51|nr:hypothetical protein [Shewanella indica]
MEGTEWYSEGYKAYINKITKCPYPMKTESGYISAKHVDWHQGWEKAAFKDQKAAFHAGLVAGKNGEDYKNPYSDIEVGFGENIKLTIPFECHKFWHDGYILGHLKFVKNNIKSNYKCIKEKMDELIILQDKYDQLCTTIDEGVLKHGIKFIKAYKHIRLTDKEIKKVKKWLSGLDIVFNVSKNDQYFCSVHSVNEKESNEMNKLIVFLSDRGLLTEDEAREWRGLYYCIYPGLERYPNN